MLWEGGILFHSSVGQRLEKGLHVFFLKCVSFNHDTYSFLVPRLCQIHHLGSKLQSGPPHTMKTVILTDSSYLPTELVLGRWRDGTVYLCWCNSLLHSQPPFPTVMATSPHFASAGKILRPSHMSGRNVDLIRAVCAHTRLVLQSSQGKQTTAPEMSFSCFTNHK